MNNGLRSMYGLMARQLAVKHKELLVYCVCCLI